jgi:hypothetical protein
MQSYGVNECVLVRLLFAVRQLADMMSLLNLLRGALIKVSCNAFGPTFVVLDFVIHLIFLF